jgi:TonB-linked SusC/RagA family outer membrane protein
MDYYFQNQDLLYQKTRSQIIRIMKLVCFILTVLLLESSATTYSQPTNLDVHLENVTIKDVFKTIEAQSEFRFFYSDDLSFINKRITVDMKNKTVESILNHVLDQSELTYRILNNNLIVVTPEATLRQGAVTGTIIDDTGEPLPGVNVLVKGSVTGTVTDSKGKYSISVPDADAVLVFSFIGYVSQEITVGDRTTIDLTLSEDIQQIDEVVVVGYGTVKKANLTGSVGYIGGRELENRSVPTLTQALQGKVAGVNIYTSNGAPGARQDINLRGYTGINIDDSGNKSNRRDGPLVVIDGVQGGDLTTLEMNDVESISFLKDAASAAIYGSSAPYGVLIITTKKGRAGKPVITYNNNFGFSQPINLPHYVNSLEFAETWNEVGDNSRYTAKLYGDDVIERIKEYLAGKRTDETIKNPASDNWYSWNAAHANNDWFDIFFKKNSFSQQHNISASGATESSTYYVGLGYTQQDGLYNWANDTYQRYNARVNVSTNLTKWLTFGLRGAFSRGYTDVPAIYSEVSGGNSYSYDYFHQLGRTYPTVPLKNPDGYYSVASGVLSFTDGGRRKETTDNASLTGEFVIRPLPGWDITANYTYAGTYIENSNHRKTFYAVRPSGERVARGGTAPNYFERSMYKNQKYTMNVFTSYEKTLGSGHYFKALVGFTQELDDRLHLQGSNDNLYSDEITMLSMTYGTNRNVGDDASQLAIRGTFGRINYSYQDKYLLEFNGRYDGTSRFMKDVRYKFYPGVSAAWAPSGEAFWEPLRKYVSSFKLRASWASLGDQAFTGNWYPFYPSLNTNSPTGSSNRYIFSGGRESIIWQPGLVNYNLTWITVNTLGFGVDLLALNNRLNFSFDWFKRDSKDFADYGEKLPALLGTGAPRVNAAETETKGFEVTLGWRDQIGRVSYGVNLVLSDYVGKVVKYNNPTKLISDTWYDGMTMGEIWGYETVGLFKNQAEIDGADQSYLNANWYVGDVHYRDLSGEGKLDIGKNTVDDPGDRRIIGNTTPRYSFGVTLNAEWNGFDASVFLQGTGKRDIMFSTGANYFWGFTNGEWQSSYFTEHTDRWTENNPNGYFPRAYFNTDKNLQAQTRYLQNTAYLRVKNIQLGYAIPREITDRIKFQKVRIFVNIENLATFTKLMKIIDPEIVNTDAKVYPLRRTWAFGVNVTF